MTVVLLNMSYFFWKLDQQLHVFIFRSRVTRFVSFATKVRISK